MVDGTCLENMRCESIRGFESLTFRQEQPRLNFGKNTMQYVFINGVAGIVAMRQKEPKSYANNYNVHGANGRFAKLQ